MELQGLNYSKGFLCCGACVLPIPTDSGACANLNYIYCYIFVCAFRASTFLTDLKNGTAAVELSKRVSGICVLPISPVEPLELVCYLFLIAYICTYEYRHT